MKKAGSRFSDRKRQQESLGFPAAFSSACRKRKSLFRQEGIAVRCAQGLCALGARTPHLRPEKYVLRRTWPRPPSLGLWPIHLAPPENMIGLSLLPAGSKLCEAFSTVSPPRQMPRGCAAFIVFFSPVPCFGGWMSAGLRRFCSGGWFRGQACSPSCRAGRSGPGPACPGGWGAGGSRGRSR